MENALIRLWCDAFGDKREFAEGYMSTAYRPEYCRCVVEDGELVGALHVMDCLVSDKLYAYIYAAAIVENHRGHGLFKKLLSDTERYLIDKGYCGTVLAAGDDGLVSAYEKLGFSRTAGLSPRRAYCRRGKGVKLRRVSAAEYIFERIKYLPEGAVLPCTAMSAFLERYASLYVGEDLVLAVLTEGGFTAAEYLGNNEKLPDVLDTFGYAEGDFYVPCDTSKAMFRSFDGTSPSFLGISFGV